MAILVKKLRNKEERRHRIDVPLNHEIGANKVSGRDKNFKMRVCGEEHHGIHFVLVSYLFRCIYDTLCPTATYRPYKVILGIET